jgi:hypothetical protein
MAPAAWLRTRNGTTVFPLPRYGCAIGTIPTLSGPEIPKVPYAGTGVAANYAKSSD